MSDDDHGRDKGLTDERLAQIRTRAHMLCVCANPKCHRVHDNALDIPELLAEVDRLREQLAAANERAEQAEAELRAERECEPEADLLHATGPTSIVLGVIRARHKSAGRGGWPSPDRSMVIAGFDDPADRQFALHAHDDVAGLLGIIERAHRDLRIMFEEHRELRARLDGLGEVTDGMVTAAWEAMGWERAPYMARVSNFTREQIDNGELREADNAATAANDDLMRTTLAAAIAAAPWREAPDAAADGHSATQAGAQPDSGRGDGMHPSTSRGEAQEASG